MSETLPHLSKAGLKPYGAKLIVEYIGEFNTKPKSNIIMPENSVASMDLHKAIVIAAGPDCKQIKAGDTVVHMPLIGAAFTYNDKSYSMIKEEGIIGTIPTESSIIIN